MKKFILALAFTLLTAACAPAASETHMTDDHLMRGGQPDVHTDHDTMTMDDMVHGLEGLSGDAFDEAFIRMMIPHHQGAIEMAELVEANAKHDELKQLAKDIAAAQQREIDMMSGWLHDWGYEE
jgi:uncharacterized protein (DUF305 family)